MVKTADCPPLELISKKVDPLALCLICRSKLSFPLGTDLQTSDTSQTKAS